MLRFGPPLAIVTLAGPVLFGLLATFLPALGYMPALGGGQFSLEPFGQLAAQPGLLQSAWLSLFTGLVAAALSLALVFLFVAGWLGTKIFARVQHLVSPLLAIPHAATAFGFIFLVAPSGFMLRLISPWLTGTSRPPDILIVNDPAGLALIAGLMLKETPFLLLIVLAALPQVSARHYSRLTQSLGYGRIRGFWLVLWPQIYSQIRLAVFAVIAFSTSVADMAIILGPETPPTLAVRLVQWFNDPDLSMRFAASAGAVLQLMVTLFAMGIWLAGERLAGSIVRSMFGTGVRARREKWIRYGALWVMVTISALVFAGIALMVLWSFSGFWAFPDAWPNNLTFKNWIRALPGLSRPFLISLTTGITATALALVLTLWCLEREARTGSKGGSRALFFVYLPLIVPQVSFVFGLSIFSLFIGLDTSWPALVFVHLIFVLPYVFLSLSDPWRAWDERYGLVAKGLGKRPGQIFWHIRLPMLLKPVLVAAAVGFAVSVAQYLPTLFIGAGRLPTITTEAVALSSGGDRRVIGVYAFLQLVLPFAGFVVASVVPALWHRKFIDMRPSG